MGRSSFFLFFGITQRSFSKLKETTREGNSLSSRAYKHHSGKRILYFRDSLLLPLVRFILSSPNLLSRASRRSDKTMCPRDALATLRLTLNTRSRIVCLCREEITLRRIKCSLGTYCQILVATFQNHNPYVIVC